jgi:hypothetical protein
VFITYHELEYQSNASYLRRVTSNWSVNTATWNAQPTATTTNQVLLADSLTHDQDYLDIDIAQLISDMRADTTHANGLMVILQDEVAYARLMFASTDHADSTKRPTLILQYYIP